MILPRFDVLVPNSVDEAFAMLSRYAEKGIRILAGGTDLLVDLRRPIIPAAIPSCEGCARHKSGSIRSTVDCGWWESDSSRESDRALLTKVQDSIHKYPEYIISLHKLKELRGIAVNEKVNLRVGAMTTITDIERSGIIREKWTALAEGADSLGSPLVRNRGTIGGNIANARPAADTFIPSVALGGVLDIHSEKGSRKVPVDSFASAPGETVMEKGEMITGIEYPAPPEFSGSAYYKLANRKALEICNVGVAVWIALEKPGGPVTDIRVALGAVGPTPILAESVKEVLVGKKPEDANIKKAAKAAREDATPIDDHRGSAWYRSMMVELVTDRMIRLAVERVGGKV
ncbi:MAG: xanthine dehydrogenase family protein subunit M [Candidatus Zixiibacteriota bacterium]|nr:MAG: xanthine dehydrogenase family protein subunit M [candidate division Zixibacteria bacterium]